jgi:hypothetical protein
MRAIDPPEPFDPPLPSVRTEAPAGACPANEEPASAATGTGPEVRFPHMTSTTAPQLGASEQVNGSEERRACASSASGDHADPPARSADVAAGDVSYSDYVTRSPDPHTIVETSSSPPASRPATGGELLPPASGGSDFLTPAQFEALAGCDLAKLEIETLGELRDRILASKSDYASRCAAIIDRIDAEATARIRADSGRALPSWDYQVEIAEEYSTYAFDDAALRRVMAMLPAEDAAKLGTVVPEHVERVPERFQRGKTNAIQAVAKKYGGAIGSAIDAAMSRSKTGEKLIFRRRTDGEAIVMTTEEF